MTGPTPVQQYSCFVFETVTGRITQELQLSADPTWTRQINGTGSWQIEVIAGDVGNPSISELRAIADGGPKHSVAIAWGNFICQAGPVWSPSTADDHGKLTLSGGGLWNIYNRRLLVHPSWDPTTTPITDPSADLYLTGQLWDIAALIAYEATRSDTVRPQTTLAVDIPAVSGTGDHVRFYPGYDCAYAGQRLQELTQVDGGPDIDFSPYFSGGGIRWGMFIGQPYLRQPGDAVVWDWGTNLQTIPTSGDWSGFASSALVKGSGNERGLLTSYKSSTTLTTLGWPSMDYIDTSHSSATEQATLDGYATADLALFGTQVKTWTPIVRADVYPMLGTYWPGTFARYDIEGHPWIADGSYSIRIIGMANGAKAGEVRHILAPLSA